MRCPFCRTDRDRVVDSRCVGDGDAIRRRRVCLECDKRFTTYERPEVSPRMVVKKDGSRAAYSRDKILRGMITACEKRRISMQQLNQVVDQIEGCLFDGAEREVATASIGEHVRMALKDLDQVAYVRFTSVYQEFKDIREFLQALAPLLDDVDVDAVGDQSAAAASAATDKRDRRHIGNIMTRELINNGKCQKHGNGSSDT